MDNQKRQQRQLLVEQAGRFETLKNHPDWDYFWKWVELARNGYEARLKSPNNRADHIELVRAGEGYDALNNILTQFEKTITDGIKARVELAKDTDGKQHESTTGRLLS